MKLIKLLVIFLYLFITTNNCGKKMPLPAVEPSPESFGASDTTYTHLLPDWDAVSIAYQAEHPMTPMDIAIGLDNFLFIADSANDKVITLKPSGELVDYQNLDNIAPVTGPVGVAIDSKLNLLVVNCTNTIYVWDQYMNNIGVDSIAVDINTDGNKQRFVFSADIALIDSVLNIHPFYVDENKDSDFRGVTFGSYFDNSVYVTDRGNDRIIQLNIEIGGVVKLQNGELHPVIKGTYSTDIAQFGSGAGTVDNPRGITADDEGNIYFAQLGGNFFVQKLVPEGNGYRSGYTLYEDPIMDLERFAGPYDIALGKENAIFVVDTESESVHKFANRGSKAGKPVSLGKTGLSEANFNRPKSIAIDVDEIVYIADTANNKIQRFKYSISEEDLPVEQP